MTHSRSRLPLALRPGAGVALLAAILISACSTAPAATPTPRAPAPTLTAPAGSPVAIQEPLTVVVAATDLAVGRNRFAFGLLDAEGPIRTPEVRVTFYHVDGDPSKPAGQDMARFVRWPSSKAGVYVVQAQFPAPGRWGVVVETPKVEGETPTFGQSGFIVKAESSSPALGEVPPPIVNRTAADVPNLAELTSAREPDPDLYRMTVADALESGRPSLIAFATPLFCSTATCGPQLQVLSALNERHAGKVNFIHIEVYENPHEMKEDFSAGRVSPHMDQWGLLTEPFTFVLDAGGRVTSKFEGFATEEELEAALAEVLPAGG